MFPIWERRPALSTVVLAYSGCSTGGRRVQICYQNRTFVGQEPIILSDGPYRTDAYPRDASPCTGWPLPKKTRPRRRWKSACGTPPTNSAPIQASSRRSIPAPSSVSSLFGEAARRVREEHRAGQRTVAQRSVGSTLLLKGLEADMAVILNASEMDARHLYVAMTRGARRLVVCARAQHLLPAA